MDVLKPPALFTSTISSIKAKKRTVDASRRPFLLCLLARLASLLFLGLRVSLGALSRFALAMAAGCYWRWLPLVLVRRWECAAAHTHTQREAAGRRQRLGGGGGGSGGGG